MHLILVEDDDVFVRSLSDLLELKGHQTTYFTDAEAAWQNFQKFPFAYDGLLLDLKMPGMSGIELLQRIRELKSDIPVTIITGFADLNTVSSAVCLGITGLLNKPLKWNQLKVVLEKMAVFSPKLGFELDWKEQMVKLLQLSLDCWRQQGGTRISLALESGIWTATQDAGSMRTSTLNRYLKLSRLPQSPKWWKVMDTANFVLRNSTLSPVQVEIEIQKQILIKILRDSGLYRNFSRHNPHPVNKRPILPRCSPFPGACDEAGACETLSGDAVGRYLPKSTFTAIC